MMIEQDRRCAINYLNELKASTNGYAVNWLDIAIKALEQQPSEDVGELSDGYHTFNQLYHQRAVLFACIVKQNKNKAWKSFKHSDGKYCFDSNGEWFIVGVDTPQGSYTYHYAKEYWDMFDCQELECGKEWDGHTEEDVTRLLSLPYIEMKGIKCPYDLNQFILGEPIFENTFSKEECDMRKFYGDCFHCFATAIAKRDHQLKYGTVDITDGNMIKMTREEAIEFGNMWLDMNEDAKDSNTYTFFQLAIKALELQPSEDKE